jgi:peptidoglycan/xylan/chitin deacetylase (PgdA/CDA1 family)
MDWEELAAQIRAGGVAIGSHGLNHEPLTTCGSDDLRLELAGSRALIRERLGVTPEAVAYPNGDNSREVVSTARECGYSLGFTTVARHVRPDDDPLALPRILVGRRDTPSTLTARLAGWQEWLKQDHAA